MTEPSGFKAAVPLNAPVEGGTPRQDQASSFQPQPLLTRREAASLGVILQLLKEEVASGDGHPRCHLALRELCDLILVERCPLEILVKLCLQY